MKKILFMLGIFTLLLGASIALAHEHGDFSEAKELIESRVGCGKLSEDQLELIGDYFMEQMHPGEEHELMDEMMGGEGSENLRLMHIRMARMMYCGEGGMMDSGMMGSGMMGGQGMMRGGMMPMMMRGMMGGGNMMSSNTLGGYNFWTPWNLVWFAFWLLILLGLILLVVWLYRKAAGKQAKESPTDILKKRYAQGELTKNQFEEMKEQIGGE